MNLLWRPEVSTGCCTILSFSKIQCSSIAIQPDGSRHCYKGRYVEGYTGSVFVKDKESEMRNNEIVIFETEDKSVSLSVMMENDTVWLSQSQMIELFERDQSVISRHIRNVFKEKEVDEKSNMHFLHIANSDRPVAYYSLDVIISVGYRVKSRYSVEFRKWANSVLKQYIMQGYAVNYNRIRQLGEVICIMKRTENELDSKQVLSVIEKYSTVLDLLDSYAHQNMKRPKGNEAAYVLTYEECKKV